VEAPGSLAQRLDRHLMAAAGMSTRAEDYLHLTAA
jgi:hypothetical protein